MTEISVHLRTTTFDDAFADLRDAINRYMHRQRREDLPDRVCVPFDQARVLKRLHAAKASSSSAWECLTAWMGGLQMELVALPPVRVVARVEVEIAVPHVRGSRTDFVKAWGYESGECNREPNYPNEGLEYGLGPDSLIPIKWPEPPGFEQAACRHDAGQRQTVTIEVLSDGTRRIVVQDRHGNEDQTTPQVHGPPAR